MDQISPIPTIIRSPASRSKASSGLEYHLTQHFSLFGDYKLSYSDNDASLKDGGSLQTDILTNHVIVRRVLPLRRRSSARGLRSL